MLAERDFTVQNFFAQATVLGASWIVISGVISPLIWVTIIVILLITLLITTHEPPSRGLNKFIAYKIAGWLFTVIHNNCIACTILRGSLS